MKKQLLLTKVLLIAICLMGGVSSVWAEDLTSSWKADGSTATAANTVLLNNEAIKATTYFATTKNSDSKTIAGTAFTHYIQVRNAAYPTVEVPQGTENSGSTSIELDAEIGGTLTLFYMRQSTAQADNKGTYAENDGKDLKVYKQSDASVLTGTFTIDSESADGKNGWATKVVTLEAGTKYTLSAKGTTIRFYGFSYAYEDPWVKVYSKALSGWTSSDISSTEWVATNVTPTTSTDANTGLCCSGAPGGGYTVKKTFSISSNAKVKYEGVWSVNRVTGRDANYCYIQFGDKIRISVPNGGTYYLNTDGTSSSTTSTGYSNTTKGVVSHTFSIIIDTSTKTVESFTFNNRNLLTLVSGTISGNFDSFTIGYQRGGSGSSANNLTSLTVSQLEQEVTNVGYTVNYQLSGVTVKTVSNTSVVGETITAETAIDGTEEGYVGVHYLSTESEASTMELVSDAASNVLNVPVRLPYTATVRLTKNINGASSYVDFPFTETDAKVCSYAVGWPMYEKDGDNYFSLTGETDYSVMGTFVDGETISKTVNYTTAATDVIWFNDINGASVTSTSYSGGSYTNTNSQLANVTVDKGIYDVIFKVVSKAGSGSSHRNAGVSVNGENVANLSGNVNGIRTLRITVENNESVITAYGNGASNYTDNLDYVLIKKLPSTVSVPCTTTFATYANQDYALDFTGVTGLKAYTATVSGDVVTFTPATQVPAGTGLLLKGETKDVPVIASAAAVDNLLFAPTTAVAGLNYDQDNYYNYILSQPAGKQIGFYRANNNSVAVGKAYLRISKETPVRQFSFIGFDDENETNGISSLTSTLTEGERVVYNLNGQRVNAPTKGLYIVNGKKMLMK